MRLATVSGFLFGKRDGATLPFNNGVDMVRDDAIVKKLIVCINFGNANS